MRKYIPDRSHNRDVLLAASTPAADYESSSIDLLRTSNAAILSNAKPSENRVRFRHLIPLNRYL